MKELALTGETHISVHGRTVHHAYTCFRDIHDFREQAIKSWGAVCELKTGNGFVSHFFSVKRLLEVSYCEGDVYVLFFENIKDMKKAVVDTMKFYEENEGIQYNYSAELFLFFQDELLNDIN